MKQNLIFNTFFYKFKFFYQNKNQLIQDLTEQHKKKPSFKPSSWREDIHTSFYYDYNSDNFLFNKAKIPTDLVEKISDAIRPIYNRKEIKSIGNCYLSEIWYNAYKENQYQKPHRHNNLIRENTIFSGIWYLKYNSDVHLPTRFYNPNFELDTNLISSNEYLCYSPCVEEEDLIIFPSNIKHDVPKQVSNDLRITIAFNIDCELVES